MGKKNKMFRFSEKWGRKFSSKPIMKKLQEKEVDTTLLDNVGNYILEEEVKPAEVVLEEAEEVKEEEPKLQQAVKKPKPIKKKTTPKRRASKKKE